MPTRRTSRSPASSSSASSRRGSRSGSDTSSLGALSSQPSNRGGCHTRTLSNSDGVTPGDTASPLAPDDAQNNNAAPLDAATGLPAARHGALTASIINMLLPPPPVMVPADLEASTSDDHALRSLSPTTRPQSPSTLRGPQSPGTSTTALRPSTEQGKHALSKESLDVLRAERIARRMEQEQQRLQQQQQAVNLPLAGTAAGESGGGGNSGGGGTTRRRHKSSRKERPAAAAGADRVYLSMATTPATTRVR